MTERTSVSPRGVGLGELLALVSVFAYTTVNTLVRSVSLDVDHVAATLVRQLPTVAIAAIAVAIVRPLAIRPSAPEFIGTRHVWSLLISGVISFMVGNILLMQAFALAGLGAAVVAVQGGMIVGGFVLSWLVLKERPSNRQFTGAAIVVLGLIVAVLPSIGAMKSGWSGLLGFLAAFGAGTCYTIANTASRAVQRGGRKAFLAALLLSSLGGLIALLVVALARAGFDVAAILQGMTGREILIMVGVGLANSIAVGASTGSVRYTSVATVSTISTLIIVLSVAAGVIFFAERPHPLLLTGAGLILLGVLASQNFRSTRPSPNPQQKDQVVT